MKELKSAIKIFGVGAVGYSLIEILWRGNTHWSMSLAGGISLCGLSRISKKMRCASLFKKALAGCGLITAVEYVFGLIFNCALKKNVWDYSHMPFNIGGQVCALYSFFWFVLSLGAIPLADRINR